MTHSAPSPCPFCGGDAAEAEEFLGSPEQLLRHYWIACRQCGARGPQLRDKERARRGWERREAPERIRKALEYAQVGLFDGAHHKQWVIDQMVRALTGCPMVEETAKDQSYVYQVQGESEHYQAWVRALDTDWDTGIGP